ncbi:MAG: hypothetical protein K9L26_00770, partial [Candidatus Izimaplasma sp.]|nr:hypothetical protein [Candidatus Izimaplasma bacterium]
ITISGDEQQTEMIIKIADYISQITLDDHVNQYRYLDGVCEQQYIYQQTLVTETVDCQDNNQFLFIKQLDYTWFELNQGTYQLRETYIGSFQDLIESGLPSFIVESVTLSIADQYVSGLTLSLTKNTLSYNIQIHISKIDNVTLMWGEINE